MTNPTPHEIQLVEAALEAAAGRIENGSFLHDKSPAALFAKEAAKAIRSLDRAAIVASVVLPDSSFQEVPQPSEQQCGCCGGTGRMVRDPDIGTDQECFACDGTGMVEDEQPEDERARFEAAFEIDHIRSGMGHAEHGDAAWWGWQAAKRDALTQAQQETVRWKFTGIAGLKQYLTDSQYQAQTDGVKKWYEPICETCQTIAPQERAAVTDEVRSLIAWLLGEEGKFPDRPERVEGKIQPLYWWRTELRQRWDALLSANQGKKS